MDVASGFQGEMPEICKGDSCGSKKIFVCKEVCFNCPTSFWALLLHVTLNKS